MTAIPEFTSTERSRYRWCVVGAKGDLRARCETREHAEALVGPLGCICCGPAIVVESAGPITTTHAAARDSVQEDAR